MSGQYLYRDASSTAARGSVVFTPVTAAIPDGSICEGNIGRNGEPA